MGAATMTAAAKEFLSHRNAFADWAHVGSELMFAGRASDAPCDVSITIPTFRRPDTLAEAVASALGQDHPGCEVVVVDNDPASNGHLRLLEALPELAQANFRYYRNSENLGMYGNVNRCVELARGEWLSILHDDDLVDGEFARAMLAELAPGARFDGLVCYKRCLDQRADAPRIGRASQLVRLGLEEVKFGFRRIRRIGARQLFWGCVTGNTVGFLCRTAQVREIGGFYPEEHPSCDYFFYARFARKYRLGEYRRPLATIRVAVNSLTRKETQLACLRRGYELQNAYAGSVLPHAFAWLSPLIMARQVAVTSAFWRSGITSEEAEQQIGFRMPRDRPLILYALKLLLRGF